MIPDRLACPCCGVNKCTPELLKCLLELEKIIGKVKVTSGFRCQRRNIACGGAPKSKHLVGMAIDFMHDLTADEAIHAARKAGFSGCGVGDGWTHADLRRLLATWEYGPGNQILPYPINSL